MTLSEPFFDDSINPLDAAEDILSTPLMSFNRPNRDELFVEAVGCYGQYKMLFVWDEATGALQFCCEYGFQISDRNKSLAYETVMNINSGLWLGHFDLAAETLSPTFRYTQLFRGLQSYGADHVQELVYIAVRECDRNYPAFASLSQDYEPDPEDMVLALMPIAGSS